MFEIGVVMAATGVVTQVPPARLTRGGRIGVLVALLTLAVGLVALGGAPGQAANPANPADPAPTTVVAPGDTLWSVAERCVPGRDRFRAIDEIRRLNGIRDYTIHPGQ